MRIDLFGIKEGATIDGKLTQLRPALPALKPGQTYLVEVVVRTLGLGHPFTQGTADSNEVWVDMEARSGKRSLGRSGGMVESARPGRLGGRGAGCDARVRPADAIFPASSPDGQVPACPVPPGVPGRA